MAVTCDEGLLREIADCTDLHAALPDFIRRSLLIKKRIVEEDPTEQGLRRVLNFGHTVGHAVEAWASGRLLHGECVALGMLPFCSPQLRSELRPILCKFGLPTELPCSPGELLPFFRHDKKRQTSKIIAVCSDKAGTYRFDALLPEEIAARLEEMT